MQCFVGKKKICSEMPILPLGASYNDSVFDTNSYPHKQKVSSGN